MESTLYSKIFRGLPALIKQLHHTTHRPPIDCFTRPLRMRKHESIALQVQNHPYRVTYAKNSADFDAVYTPLFYEELDLMCWCVWRLSKRSKVDRSALVPINMNKLCRSLKTTDIFNICRRALCVNLLRLCVSIIPIGTAGGLKLLTFIIIWLRRLLLLSKPNDGNTRGCLVYSVAMKLSCYSRQHLASSRSIIY